MAIEMVEEDEGQCSSKKWRMTRKKRTRTLERRGGRGR
jgi:hypothetical protein